MKRCAALVASAVAFTSLAWGQAAPKLTTLERLETPIPQVSFEEAPFDQVMEWVAETTGVNVVVRWPRLEGLGIERDKPISINVTNLKLSQVLWMIMNEAGSTDVKLAYRMSGNLLVMSSADDLGQEMLVKSYDVSDLLMRIQKFYSAPQMDISQQNSGSQGGSGGNIFGGQGGGQTDDEERNRGSQNNEQDNVEAKQLIDLITKTIEPDSWDINSGHGTIMAFRGQLVVRNNILVHQALGGAVEEQ